MGQSEISADFAEIDDWLSACLCRNAGEVAPVPKVACSALVHRMVYHGVVGPFAEDPHLMDGLPEVTSASMREVARGLAFQELAHQRVLTRLAPDFAAAGIVPLILKGTALAYSVYDRPALRSRGDTDVVVAEADFERAQDILEAHGFTLAFVPGGRIVTSQRSYQLRDGHGLNHVIDLHRLTNNHAALAVLFPYEELRARAEPLDRLHPVFLRPGYIDALLFACYHRFMHIDAPIIVEGDSHLSENRLIWLLDMVLIARHFSAQDWEIFVTRAREKQLLRICRASLLASRDSVGLELPDSVLEALEAAPPDEAPVQFLKAGRAGRLLADLAATPGLGQKLGFLRETAFPPEAYMRAVFGQAGRKETILRLYLRRALRGFAALSRGTGGDL